MRRLALVLPLCGCTVGVGLRVEFDGSTSDVSSSSASSPEASSSDSTSSSVVDDSSSGDDESSSTGDPVPSGPTRYPSDVVHSPITAQVTERMLAVREAGPAQADDVFMKAGASSDVATANLHCFADDAFELGEHRALAGVLDVFRAGDAAGASPFDRTSLATQSGRSAGWAIDGEPSPLVAELDAIAPSLAFVHFGTNDMELGVDPGTALPGFHLAMSTLLDTLEQAGTVPIVLGLTKRADDPDADRWIPAYNAVLRGMAQARQVPFVDVWLAAFPLPNHGLGDDGLHLESYAQGACVLDDEGVQHGYNMRNLIQLEALARVDAALVEGLPPGGDELPPVPGLGD
ncbi:MAG: SGNH/GDSL hydrolase family protein, partial [Deltaproteobacteria bacterium]|nr:SGNH/GDSL hydrolase family protein [Nannocystaceae bacterium]